MRFIIAAQAGTDEAKAGKEPTFDEALFTSYMRFNEDMHRAGVLVASEGLNPAARGARVAVSQGRRHVVDGPFAESKELVGGFYIIDVNRSTRPSTGHSARPRDSAPTMYWKFDS